MLLRLPLMKSTEALSVIPVAMAGAAILPGRNCRSQAKAKSRRNTVDSRVSRLGGRG